MIAMSVSAAGRRVHGKGNGKAERQISAQPLKAFAGLLVSSHPSYAFSGPLITGTSRRSGMVSMQRGRMQDQAETFTVTNENLRTDAPGLEYCSTPSAADKDGTDVPWGVTVVGTITADGLWVKVGERYLPRNVNGREVLREDQARRQSAIQEQFVDDGTGKLDIVGPDSADADFMIDPEDMDGGKKFNSFLIFGGVGLFLLLVVFPNILGTDPDINPDVNMRGQ